MDLGESTKVDRGLVHQQIACPQCGSKVTVPIVYGYPTKATEAEARAGKIVLGGCIVMPDQPTRYCKSCEYDWQIHRRAEEELD